MPNCVMRTRDADGPWVPCPQSAVTGDPDGDALCATHLEQLWWCPDCDGFNVAGNGMPCARCQREETTPDDGLAP